MVVDLFSMLTGLAGDVFRVIGLPGAVVLVGFLMIVRYGGKALAPWAAGARDLTIAGAAFAGILRLTLGPAWRRYAAAALLVLAWWLAWSKVPGVRWPMVLAASVGLYVTFLVAAAMMARKHHLGHLPPLEALLEGYRREQAKVAISKAVKAGTHRPDDGARVVRGIQVLPDRIVAHVEPVPGQSVAEIAAACEAGKVGPTVTRAMRAQGMPVPAHAAQARVTGEHEGAAVVEIMTVPAPPRLDLAATVFPWPGPGAA